MNNRILTFFATLTLAISIGLTGGVTAAGAASIADYTSFPPFLPRVVAPNILFLLDYSASLVRPAYGDCNTDYQNCRYKFFNQNDDYNASTAYFGYFDPSSKYTCTPGSTGGSQCAKAEAGEFDGSWLNWLATTQFDVLKKVAVGGDVTASPEQGNPTKLQSLLDNVSIPNSAPVNEKDHTAPVQSVPTYKEFYKVVEKQACIDNAPDALCDTTAPQRIPYKWIDPLAPSATGVDFLWGRTTTVDDQPMNKALPFTFNYFGTDFSRINISENGYIQFTNVEESVYGVWSNTDLPSAGAPNNFVAPMWDDLLIINDSSSFVSMHTVGTAPHRFCVITYSNILPFYVSDIANKAVSFQILLFEGDSQIVFQYKDVDGGLGNYADNNTNKGISSTIGLQNSTRDKAKKFHYGTWLNLNGNDPVLGYPIFDLGEQIPLISPLENNLALHMTYGYKILRVAPGSTYTDFRVAGATDAAAYPVNIDLLNANSTIVDEEYTCSAGYYLNRYNKKCYNHVTEGFLQYYRDQEADGGSAFHLGIMYLNNADGGRVVKHFNEKDTTGWASLMTSTRSQKPTTEAPIAEALHMAQGYLRQVTTGYDLGITTPSSSWTNNGLTATCASTGNNYDPYCFQSMAQKVPCAKSFVLLVTAGNYSHDFGRNVYGDPVIADKAALGTAVRMTSGEDLSNRGNRDYGGWLDDVAYKMHTEDLRPDLEGAQTSALFVVNSFGADSGIGAPILKRAALFGGFKDTNGNGAYDEGEDNPDAPLTYFAASNDAGEADTGLYARIQAAIAEMLRNSASGTSVSVLSTSAGGEGALYQAYFYPARINEGSLRETKWPGFLRAFLLDSKQQLRDDYSGNGVPDATLDTAEDRITKMYLNPDTGAVLVDLYDEPGKLPDPAPTPVATVAMDDVVSMWEGGTQLAMSNKSERRLYLWRDANNDGVVDNGDFSSITGEAMELKEANASVLRPYLRATDDAEAVKIINFTRGAEISGYRSRCTTVPGGGTETGCLATGQRVWALGDIIYSTPTLVGTPSEKFNQIYGDQSYFAFYEKYKNRRQMVYVGANDGMLHAFNAGVFNQTTVSFTDNPASGNGWASPEADLGDEVWSFVPQESLPHLAWLACNGTDFDPEACSQAEYTHVYYVDHRPRVTDARIFNDAATGFSDGIPGQAGVSHPNGWGSILIQPLRLGGGAIDVDLNGDGDTLDAGEQSFRSAYYAFDITDPEKPPKLLWRFTAPALGFTTSYPAIVRVEDKSVTPAVIKWFMVAGSGPQNTVPTRDYAITTATTQSGKVYVVDLMTGEVAYQHPFITENAIMGDPVAVDINLDFTTDVVYIGSTISANAGRVFRINTANKLVDGKYVGQTDPKLWNYSDFFDPNPAAVGPDTNNLNDMGPLLVSPSVSMDKYGNLWVYFGSGRLKSIEDLTNSDQQRFYAIKDSCWQDTESAKCKEERTPTPPSTATPTPNVPYTSARLFNSTAVRVSTATDSASQVKTTDANACPPGSGGTCSFQQMVSSVQDKYAGWYIPLDNPASNASERVLARSSVLGGLVLFTTYQPNGDVCSILGNSYMYAVYYETGTASPQAVAEGDKGVGTDALGEFVRAKIDLGLGMPTAVGVAIGETVSGFVQKSTGEIIRIEATPALNVRSGISGWRETRGNTGNAGIEVIYEHIIK